MGKRVYSKPLIEVNQCGYKCDINYNSGFNTCYSTTRTERQRTAAVNTCYSTTITRRQRTADRPEAEGGSGKTLK